jgi:quercetin dioxygenase-like cupin family protein
MKSIFPEPISNLPEADIPLSGIQAFLSQADNHQVIFMEFAEDVDLPEHLHAAQVGIVIRGKIDLTVNDQLNTYQKGDVYYIPSGTKHSGKIYAGYADVTFFDEPDRYRQKDVMV